MDYGAQAEDKAERYEAAFHGRVSVSPARGGVPSVFFFNRVIDDVLIGRLTLDCCCAKSGTA
jgi:hypothetical protein